MGTQPTMIANLPSSTSLTQQSATTMDQEPYVLQPTGVSASQPTTLPSNTSLIPLDNLLSINVYLEQQHRKVKPSAGDDNCLFRSYTFQIFGSEEEHIAVHTAAIWLENLNQGAFKPYLTAINKATMDKHIQHVQRPSVFDTHIEILALSTLFCVVTFYCCSTGRDHQYGWHCVEPLTQEGLHYPNLTGSPLEVCSPPNHFELFYTHNVHYGSIISSTGVQCTHFPSLSTEQTYVDLS